MTSTFDVQERGRVKPMARQEDVLPDLIEQFKLLDNQCAVILIGSVANGTHRPESDIDLNVFLPIEGPTYGHPYIADDNRWQLQVKDTLCGFRIDVAWETYDGLDQRLRGDGPKACWSFSKGRILYDPNGNMQSRIAIAQKWFDCHSDVVQSLNLAYADAKREQQRRRTAQPGT